MTTWLIHHPFHKRGGGFQGRQRDEVIGKVYFNTGQSLALVEPFRRTDKSSRRTVVHFRLEVDDEVLQHMGKGCAGEDIAEGGALGVQALNRPPGSVVYNNPLPWFRWIK